VQSASRHHDPETAGGGKTIWQSAWDFLGIPFRLVLFDQAWLPRFGWTTLEDERLAAIWPHLRGRVLDVGAGRNTVINRYGNGIGVDVHDWGGGAKLIEDASRLPFSNQSFDTVTFIACLNHIPNRQEAVREARRLLAPQGSLIITMIDPVLGGVGHSLWWYSEDKHRGGMQPGEVGGLWTKDIMKLAATAAFRLREHTRFVYGMNNLYVFDRTDTP